jgi:hypothetical protein
MDWFPAVMTLIGVFVGVGVQELRIWRERKDKYKDMIFEKQLEAHQGAYYRCHRLVGFMMPEKLVEDGGIEALAAELDEYREWISKNALYLAGDSKTKMNMFFYYAFKKGKKYTDKEWIKTMNVKEESAELYKNFIEVLLSVQRGIDVKYLPEEKIQIEVSYLEKMFGEVVESKERMMEKQQKPEEKQKE